MEESSPIPKYHVLFLTDCCPDLAGGAEKQIYELSKRINPKLFRVTVISLDPQGVIPQHLFNAVGCQIKNFPVKKMYGLSGILQGIHFIKFLKKEKVDIVLTYHFCSDIWGCIFAHLAGVKLVVSNRRDMGFWRKSWHTLAYRMIQHWINKIIVVSHSVKEIVKKTENVPDDKIQVIYNGIDLSENGPPSTPVVSLKKQLGINMDEPVVMHVANFKTVKGHDYLLEAMVSVVKSVPKVKLVLIGEDEMNGRLQNLAVQLGIDKNLLFLGKRDDVQNLLPMADICVLPSLSEGMSNAILEYMKWGKPVIATQVGGNPELIEEGRSGLLVPPRNSQSLGMAMIHLLRDPFLCRQMGKNARKRVEEIFTIEKMVQNYEQLFESLI